MFRLLDMNFQSSKFKLKKFVNSWEREMNSTSYSMAPKSCVTCSTWQAHLVEAHKVLLWWMRGHHSHTELGNISEISSPRPQSSGKIFFWIVGIQASSPRCPQVPMPLHMPEIKDYPSTLAASKLIILFLEMLKFYKILFLKNNFLWRKVKNLLNYFIFNMKSSILKKLFKRHALELPSYSCNSLHYINIWNWFLW